MISYGFTLVAEDPRSAEFTLTTNDKTITPTLHDYAVSYSCVNITE